MDHPLVHPEQKILRQRVAHLLRTSYKARRASNIIFLCGGNDQTHMRMLFRDYCIEHLPNFEIFLPEKAFEYVFSTSTHDPFDIIDFEELITQLSHAVVLFPEAAGSFAETGYFSAVADIARRCILVLDSNQQRSDSFISLGPAKKITEKTVFHPLIQTDYSNPQFDMIIERIKRTDKKAYKKQLKFQGFKDLSTYELCCLVHQVVKIMSIATMDDLEFIFRMLFENRYSYEKVRKLVSVLVGSEHFKTVGEYGHVCINSTKPKLLEVRDGFAEDERTVLLEVSALYPNSELEFQWLLEASRDAD